MIRALKKQGGFAYIAAIVVCVVLAVLVTAAVRLGTTQQTSLNQEILATRAWQAARAGTEWGAYRALHQAQLVNACPALATTLAVPNGFNVTIQCQVKTYNEGQNSDTSVRQANIFQITAIACNAAACPSNAVTSPDYTERSRVMSVCNRGMGVDC